MKGFILCNEVASFEENSLDAYFNNIAPQWDKATTLVAYSLKKMSLYEVNLFRNFIKNNPNINKFVIFAPEIGETAKKDIVKIKQEAQAGTYFNKIIKVIVYEQPELALKTN